MIHAQSSGNPGKFITSDRIDFCNLTAAITANSTTDKQKVRSIFLWITNNISYKVAPSIRVKRKLSYVPEADDTLPLKHLDERVAEIVLHDRQAFCDGYARLFKTLCSYAAIEAAVITGYGKTNSGRNAGFRSNHSWNAVYFDSSWHLLDVTWASGFITYSSNSFISQLNDNYFLTPPRAFILDHYPEDLRWTLLHDAPVLNEYKHTPYRLGAFTRHYIKDYAPAKGVIYAALGDTLQFSIASDEGVKPMYIDDSPYGNFDFSNLTIEPELKRNLKGKFAGCNYVVTTENTRWLHVVFNDDIVLRYRLQIMPKDYAGSNMVTMANK